MKFKKTLFSTTLLLTSLLSIHLYYPSAHYWVFAPKESPNRVITLKSGKITHENLEKKLGITLKGDYTDSMGNKLFEIFTEIKEDNPQILKNVKRIVVLPERYDKGYSGLAILDYMIILKKGASSQTIKHEIGHNYSFSLSSDFWDSWTKISIGHYKANHFPIFWEIASKVFPRDSSKDFIQKHGLLTDYGSKNKYEDIAEFVEDIYGDSSQLMKVPLEINDDYIKKIDLLFEYGFISSQRHKKTLKKLSTSSLKKIEENILNEKM